MAATQPASPAPDALKIPLKTKLKAWWGGYDLQVKQSASEEGASPVRAEVPQLTWNEARIELSQSVWGKGYSTPGGEAYVLDLVKSLGLTPAMSVLDLGAGLGGAARTMAQQFGCWVTAMEADVDLATAGMLLSDKAGLAKKAPVQECDFTSLDLKEGTYDCVFSNGVLFTVEDKDQLLEQIGGCLKDRGQLVVSDYVAADAEQLPADWIASESIPPKPWTVENYSASLEKLGYDVRVVEDISDRFKQVVVRGWTKFLSSIEGAGQQDATKRALVPEIELWTRRVQAVDGGQLRVCRIHALKPG